MLIVINFHYIRPHNELAHPAIFPLSMDEFADQINALDCVFDFISPDELTELIRSQNPIKGQRCLITFDDGLKEQILLAEPILQKKGVQALYSVNGESIKEQRLQPVHKIHWLRSMMSPTDFKRKIMLVLEKSSILGTIPAQALIPPNHKYIYDNGETRKLKHLLNHVLVFDNQVDVVNQVYREMESDEAKHAESLYMSKDMINDLGKKGKLDHMVIGIYHQQLKIKHG